MANKIDLQEGFQIANNLLEKFAFGLNKLEALAKFIKDIQKRKINVDSEIFKIIEMFFIPSDKTIKPEYVVKFDPKYYNLSPIQGKDMQQKNNVGFRTD